MKYILLLGLMAAAHISPAQDVGLSDAEITTLRHWLNAPGADSSVRSQFDGWKHFALLALHIDPGPIDTIRSEGLLQGDPLKTATQVALQDMARMYALALLYKVSGDRTYLLQLRRYLSAWAKTNHSRGDPIDDTNLDDAIEAFDMVKGDLPPDEREAVRDWLQGTAAIEITAVYNRPNRATSYNNWHSHRLKIIGEIGFAIGDSALEGYAVRGLKVQIGRNLRPDGSSEDFALRDALHYHVYDLEPLLQLAIVVQRATGTDYYSWTSPTGSSIQHSVTWLLPYVTGEKTHAEFVNSTVEFDRRRALNGESAYKPGTLFEPKNGTRTLLLAAYFDPSLLAPARKAAGTEYPLQPFIIYTAHPAEPHW